MELRPTHWLPLALVFLACGCADFRQRHESGGYGYYPMWSNRSTFPLHRIIEEAGFPTTANAAPIKENAKLAVAELGSEAPSPWMIDAFSHRPAFASAQPCDGGARFRYHPPAWPHTRPTTDQSLEIARTLAVDYVTQIHDALGEATTHARGRGCDYVVVLMWRSEGRYEKSLFPPLDLLILPLYVVPDEKAGGHAQGMAWLIDTSNGQIVRYGVAETDSWRLATYPAMSAAVRQTLERAEAKLGDKLAVQLGARIKEQAGTAGSEGKTR